MPLPRSDTRRIALAGLLAIVLFVTTGRLGLNVAVLTGQASPVWMPAGVSVWALLTFGTRILPFLFVGGVLTSVSSGTPLLASMGAAVSQVTEGLVATWILRRLGFAPAMERGRDVAILCAALGAGAVGSFIGVHALWLAGLGSTEQIPRLLWVWMLGDAMGMLVAAPFLLAVPSAIRTGYFAASRRELLVLLGLLAVFCILIFGRPTRVDQLFHASAFLVYPAVIWTAFRFGPPGAAIANALITLLTTTATALGLGPFASEVVVEGVVALQIFLGVSAMTSLLLAAVVAERRRTESQLVATERMASIGTLAAAVVHEINNPLAFVISNLEMLERRLADAPESVRAMVHDAQLGTERMRQIARDVRVFSRGASDEMEPIRLEEVVDSAVRLAGREVGLRARLVRESDETPLVLGSPGRLGQVVLNLLLNAAQAIVPDGRKRNEVRVRTGTTPDGKAFVEVEDTGQGIPADKLERIFAPYFTTKPSGTGLGLPISRQIVEQHGGRLEVRSVEGVGSTFRVVLPAFVPSEAAVPIAAPRPTAVPAEASPADPFAAEAPAPQEDASAAPVPRRPRVLIVDDEVRLAHTLRLLLEPEHEVEIRHSGGEALDLLLTRPDFDVILCDLHMEGLSGMELHRRLAERVPQLASRMVFMSGGAYTPEARSFVETTANPILEKPVRPAKLLEVIREELAAREAS